MNNSLKGVEYTSNETFGILKVLSDDLDKSLIDLVYLYYDSENDYDKSWTLTIEEFINYLNDDILNDSRFTDFINSDKRDEIIDDTPIDELFSIDNVSLVPTKEYRTYIGINECDIIWNLLYDHFDGNETAVLGVMCNIMAESEFRACNLENYNNQIYKLLELLFQLFLFLWYYQNNLQIHNELH